MSAPDLAEFFGLRLLTPRLELRLPTTRELAELADVARLGVHAPEEMPFIVPWTDELNSPTFTQDFIGYHLGLRESWRVEDWHLEFGVWAEGHLIGAQLIHSRDFAESRTTFSGSWLAVPFHERGYGTEMRTAILELAFSGLGAQAAGSGALEANSASAHVSEKLGYVKVGERWPLVRGVPTREHRFIVTRQTWLEVPHAPVEIRGLADCRHLFGLSANQ